MFKFFSFIFGAILLTGCASESVEVSAEYCSDFENEIWQDFQDARFCESVDDCVTERYDWIDCPFGCYFFGNKNADLSPIRAKIKKYREDCSICLYECLGPPAPNEIACEFGKCVDTRRNR